MIKERYFSIGFTDASSIEDSLFYIKNKINSLIDCDIIKNCQLILRFFCSDLSNQLQLINNFFPAHHDSACLKLYIGQPPLDSAYLSVQVYCIPTTHSLSKLHNTVSFSHGIYRSFWSANYPSKMLNNKIQTDECIQNYMSMLSQNGMTLEENVFRTWYYVRDIDNNYAGMIKSRTEHYEACGLTPKTHYIASTGIEGCAQDPHTLVFMHSYAIKGLQPAQITYLKALDYLSPTHVYGVNFERATRITYGDRVHIHISGTASIDKYGNVLHKGDVVSQFNRAIENIEALLEEGGLSLSDLKSAIIYLRDAHDYPRLAPRIKAALPTDCAVNVNHAPVCRPDWLVEIEGEAIAYKSDPRFPNFI